MLSTNFQRAESFSLHRIDNKDSHEHQELIDSNELDTTSDEQVDSDEKKIVKRDVLLPTTGHSSEEEDKTTVNLLENQSDEDNVDSKEITLKVKRNIQVNTTIDGHSSEEDVTTVATLADLSMEDDGVDSEEKLKVKRNIQLEMTTIDHSSEEVTTNGKTVSFINHSEEHENDHSAELFKREVQQLTAEELAMLFQLFNSEENARAEETFIANQHSDEYDYFDSIEKRDTHGRLHSSEENTAESSFDHSYENSIEDVLEQLVLDANLPSTTLRI